MASDAIRQRRLHGVGAVSIAARWRREMKGLGIMSIGYTVTACLIVDGCSFFPDHKCCSSSSLLSEKLSSLALAGQLFSFSPVAFVKTDSAMSQASNEGQSLPKSLRILCFGDSLTLGYYSTGPEHFAYGITLQTELAHMLSSTPSQIHTEVDALSSKYP